MSEAFPQWSPTTTHKQPSSLRCPPGQYIHGSCRPGSGESACPTPDARRTCASLLADLDVLPGSPCTSYVMAVTVWGGPAQRRSGVRAVAPILGVGTRAGADAQVPRAPSDAPLAAWPAASKIGGRGASWRPDRGIMSVISTSGFRQCRKINSARERLRHPVTPPGPGAGARGPPLAEADHHPVPTTRRPRCGSLAARVYPGGDHATRHRVCSDRFTLYAPPGDQLYSPDAGAAAYRSPQLADGTAGQPGYEQDSPQPSLWSARQSPWRHPGKHFHTTYLRVTVRSPVALFESGRRQRAEPRLLIRRSVRR